VIFGSSNPPGRLPRMLSVENQIAVAKANSELFFNGHWCPVTNLMVHKDRFEEYSALEPDLDLIESCVFYDSDTGWHFVMRDEQPDLFTSLRWKK
jgi:hypothetical protein